MLLLFRFVIIFVVIFLVGNHLPGLEIHNELDALFFALIVSAINALVRPILVLLTLPITLLTLGLFTFVINLGTFYLAAVISYGVHVHTFMAVFWGALILWVTGFITNRYIWRTNIY